MSYIENLPQAEAFDLRDILPIEAGKSRSQKLVGRDNLNMVLRSLAAGEAVAEHVSTGDAFVYVLSGVAELMIDGKNNRVTAGQSLVVPANARHDLRAIEALQVLLVVVKPDENDVKDWQFGYSK